MPFRFNSSHQLGEVGIEPTASSAQDSRTTGVPHPVISCNDPCGIRTQPNQRERLTTSPEVERAGVAGLWPLKYGLNKWKLFAACLVSQAGHKNSFQLPT